MKYASSFEKLKGYSEQIFGTLIVCRELVKNNHQINCTFRFHVAAKASPEIITDAFLRKNI